MKTLLFWQIHCSLVLWLQYLQQPVSLVTNETCWLRKWTVILFNFSVRNQKQWLNNCLRDFCSIWFFCFCLFFVLFFAFYFSKRITDAMMSLSASDIMKSCTYKVLDIYKTNNDKILLDKDRRRSKHPGGEEDKRRKSSVDNVEQKQVDRELFFL